MATFFKQPGKRRIPVLASLISVFFGFASLGTLLTISHIFPTRAFEQTIAGQPPLYLGLDAASQLCLLAGSVLLWKMQKAAPAFFLAGFLLSASAVPFFRSLPSRQAPSMTTTFYGILFGAIVTFYVWSAINQWHKTLDVTIQPS